MPMPKKRKAAINAKKAQEYDLLQNKLHVLVGTMLFLFAFGTIGYTVTKDVSPFQGFVYTIETLTFLHDHEDTVAPKVVQIILLLFGSFFVWFVLWTTFDLLLEGNIADYFNGVTTMNQINGL